MRGKAARRLRRRTFITNPSFTFRVIKEKKDSRQ